jgi:hypothetical protein
MNKRDFVAKDLRTPKYKMRVVPAAKLYNRKKENSKLLRELKYA